MRKIFLITLLFTAGMVSFQSCQQEIDPDILTNNPVTGEFKAKIDGAQWVANRAASAQRIAGFINITGLSFQKKHLTITLLDSGAKTYTLNDMTLNAASYIDSTLANPINFTTNQGVNPGDAGGTVTITSIDAANKKISGTFSFKVFRQADGQQRTFTEGSFTNLSYSTTLPPASSTDTLNLKVNGTAWVPPSIVGVASPGLPPVVPATIAIVGNSSSGDRTIGITMPANITAGTYTLDANVGFPIGQYNRDLDPAHSQVSVSGTLTIISHNTTTKRIRGNFNFRGEETLNPASFSTISEGYFAVTYQ